MPISHRLTSPMSTRPDEGLNEKPKRIIFLSVEGNVTEVNYFDFVQKYREKIGINGIIRIEILSRGKDTNSDVMSVYELLRESMSIHNEGISTSEIHSVLSKIDNRYSEEKIKQYIDGALSPEETEIINKAILFAGVDIKYQKYLSEIKSENNDDVFAVVIDRDKSNHSEHTLKKLFKICEKDNCRCFITNPCFEFWLLLHICDVKEEYKDCLDELCNNVKISNKHTYVSNQLSKRAGHAKRISETTFIERYLPNINTAINRAKDFAQDKVSILNDLGSNLPTLFETLMHQPRDE